ncbi:MAG: RNA polymerase sigma factor [Gaiellaceae bacterium]
MTGAPPFERFYRDHRDAVFAYLTRQLGASAAEDAFQETFLRALRAYGGLRHADHLRGWVFTIATRVAVDEHRRRGRLSASDIPDVEAVDDRPSYAELSELTSGLPPKERAAVVLRYGYDLDYGQIGTAIGSSPEAARQAASSGVRRLRREEER